MRQLSPELYTKYLLSVAGLGGLLYGVDIGIISAALLFVGKTITLSVVQTSMIVAAVLGGSMASSLVSGVLADWWGRRTMMRASAVLFLSSVLLIVLSHGFICLFLARLLQGLSGGVIAVVVPLYLAECLGPTSRGRGSAIFQLMLTLGIVLAAAIGWHFTRNAELAIAAANGQVHLIFAAEQHAWHSMFLAVLYPGICFFAGTLFLSESPRWLLRHGRHNAAAAALRHSCSEQEAVLQLAAIAESDVSSPDTRDTSTLLQRKYVVPFLLACAVLAFNQATGINSILSYLALILKSSGFSARNATLADFAIKLINCIVTVFAVTLIDKKGRRFLLILGTTGIIASLSGAAFVFRNLDLQQPEAHGAVWIALCLGAYIAAFAIGPGVVVWLALSELMPTRIRSTGMGIALLINQGVSTVLAGLFLPLANRYGFSSLFGFCAVCTVAYLLCAIFLLPETKGKSLEEIEMSFSQQGKRAVNV